MIAFAIALEISVAATTHALPGDFNERHLTVSQPLGGGVFATAFHNSEDRLSLGLGKRFSTELSGSVDGFCDLALVTGYDYAAVLPFARCGFEVYDKSRLWVAPAATPEGEIGVVFGLELLLFRSE